MHMGSNDNVSADGAGARRVAVLYNPAAGQWRRRRLEATIKALKELGCNVTLRETTRPGDAEAMASRLSLADCDVVGAAGGDGTINEVANGLMAARRPAPPLAIIPLGTANVLAQEIGLRGKPDDVARTIARGSPIAIHPGQVNGRYFLMMVGAGFDAHVVANVDLALKRRAGKLAYVAGTLSQALRYGFPPCRVVIDGREFRTRSAVVCNGRHYGGPFIAAPKADLAAPGFEICLFERGGWLQVIRYGFALVTGRLPTLPGLSIESGRSIRIDGEAGLPVQGDGDIVTRLPVDIVVSERQLELIVP